MSDEGSALQSAINSLHGKTVTITVRETGKPPPVPPGPEPEAGA
jgi:hypothetical protein